MATLKAARQALDKKDYKEALKICKEILKQDKKNYTAWLFFGVAATSSPEHQQHAEPALRSAIQLDPTNELAWRGLLELYSKTNDKPKQVEVYKELLKFGAQDEKKVKQLTYKLAEILASININESIDYWLSLIPLVGEDLQQLVDIWKHVAELREEIEKQQIKEEAENRMNKNKAQKPKGKVGKEEKPIADPNAQKIGDFEKEVTEEFIMKETIVDETYKSIIGLSYPGTDDYYIKYINRMMIRRKRSSDIEISKKIRSDIINECKKMMKDQPQSYYPLVTLLLLNEEDDGIPMGTNDINKLKYKLLHMFPEHGMSSISIGLLLSDINRKRISDRKHLSVVNDDARNFIVKGLKSEPGCLAGRIELINLYIENTSYQSAIDQCNQSLQIIANRSRDSHTIFNRASLSIRLLSAKSNHLLNKKDVAMEIYTEILSDIDGINLDAIKGLADISYEEKQYEQAEKYLRKILEIQPNNDFALAQLGWMSYQQGKLDDARNKLEKAISINGNNYMYHHWLGVIYWNLGGEYKTDKKYAQMCFLQSAKLSINYNRNYTYLGMYYQDIDHDIDRSKRCYQKSLSLDPLDEESGMRLSDIYINNGQESLAINIYKEITSRSNRIKWAWRRLAIYQLINKKYDDAVVSYQTSLKSDPHDSICWQGLAETYRQQGKYTAALKAFSRAVELDPSLTYSQYQVAAIQKMMGYDEKSIRTFERALEHTPNYLPTLKALGEAYLSLSKDQLKNGFYLRSSYSISNAIITFEKCLTIQNNITCIWKLLGDSYTYFYYLPPSLSNPKSRDTVDFDRIDIKLNISNINYKLNQLINGEKSYRKAIELDPDLPSLRYDLSINLYYQYHTIHNTINGGSGNGGKDDENDDKKRKCLINAKNEIKNGIIGLTKRNSTIGMNDDFNPVDFSLFWNAYGVIEESPKLKQHSFIKSLHYDPKNYNAWNNLGLLYLENGKFIESNQCFEISISISSNQSIAWLGQGLIQEFSMKKENLKNAKILYKHSLGVGVEHVSQSLLALGYVSLALDDFNTASDVLRKYVEIEPLDESGHNMYGLSLEGIGLLNAAEHEFSNSISLLQSDIMGYSSDKNVTSDHSVTLNSTLIPLRSNGISKFSKLRCSNVNHARVLSTLGISDKSIEENIKADPNDPDTWNYLGLSYFQQQQFDKSCKAFEKALEIGSEDTKKEVLLCLSQIYYAQKNYDKAKQYIAQCVKKYPNYMKGWINMCALAIQLKDSKVAEHGIKQLRKIDESIHSIEFYYIQFFYHLINHPDNISIAKSILCKGIHLFPNELKLWNKLMRLVSDYYHDTLLISNLSRVLLSPLCNQSPSSPSQRLRSYDDMIRHEQSIVRLNEIARSNLIFGRLGPQYKSNDVIKISIKSISRSIHNNPVDDDSWYLLSISSYSDAILSRSDDKWISSEISIKISLSKLNHSLSRSNLSQSPSQQQQHSLIDQIIFLHFALSDSYLSRKSGKKINEARDIINQAITKYGNSGSKYLSNIYRQLARIEFIDKLMNNKKDQDIFNNILKIYNNSINCNPIDVLSWQELSQFYEYNSDITTAKLILEKCIDIVKEKDTMGYYSTLVRLSHLELITKRYDKVNEYIDIALDLFPDSAVAAFIKGISLWKSGDMAGSEDYLQRSIMIDSSLPAVNYYLSLVHFHIKEYDIADSDLHYELDNYPLCDPAYYQLGRISLLLKKPMDLSRKFFEKSIHINPSIDQYWKELEKTTQQQPVSKK